VRSRGNASRESERPATYREVFAVREFSALFTAHLLSLVGDQLAKIAVALLVLDRTGSQFWSAVSFGIGYLPWVLGGPLLSALADRYPRRTVMIGSDLARTLLVAAIAVPNIPVWAIVTLLFASALFAPPFNAARSASMPEILDGDRYVLGTSVTNITIQFAQVAGFLLGGLLVKYVSLRGAVLIDAGTFGLSAMLITQFMRARRHAPAARRPSLLRETAAGVRLVFGNRVLTSYLVLAWVGAAFLVAPEGLMPTYARYLGGDSFTVGLLYATIPFGATIGMLVYGRFTAPARRMRQIRPMALISLLGLAPVAMDPGLGPLLALLAVAGYGGAYQLGLNAAFVQAVPAEYRARAFGVAVAGLQIAQGLAIALAGALADHFSPPVVVGMCGLVGAMAALPTILRWPDDEELERPMVARAA
jgi:MFS family permease